MDSGSIIIGIIVLSLIGLPFFFMGKTKRKNQHKILNGLVQLASEQGSSLGQYDLFNNLGVGIDRDGKKLFYYQSVETTESKQFVCLEEVKSCKVQRVSSRTSAGKEAYQTAEKLGLLFTFRDKTKADIMFAFFNSEHSLRLAGELQLAEKWLVIVNSKLHPQNATGKTMAAVGV